MLIPVADPPSQFSTALKAAGLLVIMLLLLGGLVIAVLLIPHFTANDSPEPASSSASANAP